MTAPSIRPLVDKLNSTCRDALEGAAAICLSRTNYHVEIEHWLLKLCEPEDTDLRKIFKHYDVDLARITQELTDVLDRLRTGNARSPDLSLEVIDLMREAWNLASLDFGDTGLRTGYLLTALLTDRQLGLRMESSSRELCRIPAEKLRQEVAALMKISAEAGPAPAGPSSGAGTPKSTGTQALDQYTLNLTERARNGQIDPVIGRGEEIRQVIDILTRRRQNNPILTGDAGVGKTAVVEGFAIRVTSGNVPAPLRNVEIRTLDLGLLQAGAGIKGEFENRLKSVIAEVKASPVPIILFIDEAHTLIGAGAAAGQGDAANLLKPALARGELRTIAATTWREYKKSFETDAALKRRFQVVKVEEPDPDRAIKMLRGLAPTLRSHHKVCILEEALEDAVKLSFRYIPDRQLPDKAVSLLDTACARVALSQSATPPLVEDTRREIEFLDAEITALKREANAGLEHAEQLEELAGRKDDAEKKLLELQKRWASEKQLVEQINTLQSELDDEFDDVNDSVDTPQRRVELQRLTEELTQLQGEQPLVHPVVDRQAVAEIVSAWTGIPIGKMVLDEIQTVLKLKDRLEERVVGQSHALEAIAQRIKTSRAAMADPRRPIGVFLLAGPSGVGKTETAMALAEVLYGGSRNMVVVNMCILLLTAGIDTTWSSIGSSLLHFATQPADRRRLAAEPALLSSAVEEMLRLHAPVSAGRIAMEDVEHGDATFKRGERLILNLPAANRDPEVFERPDEAILDREKNRHVAFGVGVHRCAGSNLARMEMEIALGTWFARIPEFELTDPDAVTWSAGQVRGARNVPVRF